MRRGKLGLATELFIFNNEAGNFGIFAIIDCFYQIIHIFVKSTYQTARDLKI
jgi:hypothetical protein